MRFLPRDAVAGGGLAAALRLADEVLRLFGPPPARARKAALANPRL